MSTFQPDNIIVIVRHDGEFQWYKSEREYWILDWYKWRQVFIDAGITDIREIKPTDRFGVPAVTDSNVAKFLEAMQPFKISKSDLGKELKARFDDAESWWDVGDLFPIMLVNFDDKHVCAFYPSGDRMERYVPDGWTGEFEDFATVYSEEQLPTAERFWIQNGVNMLDELNARGAEQEH